MIAQYLPLVCFELRQSARRMPQTRFRMIAPVTGLFVAYGAAQTFYAQGLDAFVDFLDAWGVWGIGGTQITVALVLPVLLGSAAYRPFKGEHAADLLLLSTRSRFELFAGKLVAISATTTLLSAGFLPVHITLWGSGAVPPVASLMLVALLLPVTCTVSALSLLASAIGKAETPGFRLAVVLAFAWCALPPGGQMDIRLAMGAFEDVRGFFALHAPREVVLLVTVVAIKNVLAAVCCAVLAGLALRRSARRTETPARMRISAYIPLNIGERMFLAAASDPYAFVRDLGVAAIGGLLAVIVSGFIVIPLILFAAYRLSTLFAGIRRTNALDFIQLTPLGPAMLANAVLRVYGLAVAPYFIALGGALVFVAGRHVWPSATLSPASNTAWGVLTLVVACSLVAAFLLWRNFVSIAAYVTLDSTNPVWQSLEIVYLFWGLTLLLIADAVIAGVVCMLGASALAGMLSVHIDTCMRAGFLAGSVGGVFGLTYLVDLHFRVQFRDHIHKHGFAGRRSPLSGGVNYPKD